MGSSTQETTTQPRPGSQDCILRLDKMDSWAYLRAAHFTGRPGHADQLHLDLWYRGINLAGDPGTYLYNAPSPWDNAFTHAAVHNTITVDDRDQMTRSGRFLYLDRAQTRNLGRVQGDDWESLSAEMDGYRTLGLNHRREVTASQDGRWLVEDALLPLTEGDAAITHRIALHWLLPDWEWTTEELAGGGFLVRVRSPRDWVSLRLSIRDGEPEKAALQIARAGERVYGQGEVNTVWGWSSPTYGDRIPALSVRFFVDASAPLNLLSEWTLP